MRQRNPTFESEPLPLAAFEGIYPSDFWLLFSETCFHNIQPMHPVQIASDATICTPPDLNIMTSYVLLEQEDWLEAETAFVQQFLCSGMHVLDIGACFGVYAVPMARQVGPRGKVYAFEPGARARRYLMQSRECNALDNLEIIPCGLSDAPRTARLVCAGSPELNQTVAGTGNLELMTLDDWSVRAGTPEIDFVKLDASGHEHQIVRGGTVFFQQQSPVILFARNNAVISALTRMGFDMYQYLPGLRLLTPWNAIPFEDAFRINLVAARPEQARQMQVRGLLAAGTEPHLVPPPLPDTWQAYIYSLPWAETIIPRRNAAAGITEEYHRALNYLCMAHLQSTPAAHKPLLVQQALVGLQAQQRAHSHCGARAMSLVRAAWAAGLTHRAVKMLQVLHKHKDAHWNAPFLPPLPHQDHLPVTRNGRLHGWIAARCTESLIQLRYFSSYFSGRHELPLLKTLRQNPDVTPPLQRRLSLIALREGRPLPIHANSPLLRVRSDHRNTWFWQGLAVTTEAEFPIITGGIAVSDKYRSNSMAGPCTGDKPAISFRSESVLFTADKAMKPLSAPNACRIDNLYARIWKDKGQVYEYAVPVRTTPHYKFAMAVLLGATDISQAAGDSGYRLYIEWEARCFGKNLHTVYSTATNIKNISSDLNLRKWPIRVCAFSADKFYIADGFHRAAVAAAMVDMGLCQDELIIDIISDITFWPNVVGIKNFEKLWCDLKNLGR